MIDLREHASNVTSQHGENGIIGKIFETIGISNRVCIEFGAFELRRDSNVFPLWSGEGWSALLVEASDDRASAIERAYKEWTAAHPGTGRMILQRGFVEPTGPNSLDTRLEALGFPTDPDLCVIDVDGMDYHIFAGFSRTTPRVVVCEFNPTIPPHLSVIPNAESNSLGCSARALCDLARARGYSLVACTKVNCIFVRAELAAPFANRDDLDTLFDSHALVYLMGAYDGSVFLSQAPYFDSNLLSHRAVHDLRSPNQYFVPVTMLPATYVASRFLFSWIERHAPSLAAKSLDVLRRFRRVRGSTLLTPAGLKARHAVQARTGHERL